MWKIKITLRNKDIIETITESREIFDDLRKIIDNRKYNKKKTSATYLITSPSTEMIFLIDDILMITMKETTK